MTQSSICQGIVEDPVRLHPDAHISPSSLITIVTLLMIILQNPCNLKIKLTTPKAYRWAEGNVRGERWGGDHKCNTVVQLHVVQEMHVLRQPSLVAINTRFVAIDAPYCNKLHHHCNMVAILQQTNYVARDSRFVVIETRYFNRISISGNIWKDIPTSVRRCVSYKYRCESLATYCNKICIGRNSVHFKN